MVGINAPYYTIGYQAVRRVNGIQRSYSLVNEFPTGRWYPGIMTLPNGNILIVGGAQIVSCSSCRTLLHEARARAPVLNSVLPGSSWHGIGLLLMPSLDS